MAKLLHKESELDFEAYQNKDERTLADMVKTPNGKVLASRELCNWAQKRGANAKAPSPVPRAGAARINHMIYDTIDMYDI